jgi:hypothetical protein
VTTEEHRFRIERLEQAFQALIEEVASNPHLAVEMARANMRLHDDAREREQGLREEQ